ncbi:MULTISPECIES: hypothetical protein [Marinobacter]|uniref:Uncharacterized protein n=1 Tax=Marinobacter profundi TaxID=2666256 RepID=A0A2G1UK24_9GAMM|nr:MULTISPECIES: hypothetical protein [Marinobacter]MBD3657043.1 hypothetical protein [Marinobacter sp.]PHQ14770.1 hypothetical protein CLH61_10440 [Marinobacter profundi]
MSDEEYKKLHPILHEVTRTYVDLYTNRPNEKNRVKLIKLEALLHENLQRILQAKEEVDDEK